MASPEAEPKPEPEPKPILFLTVKEFAARAKCDIFLIHYQIRTGHLVGIRMGKLWMIPEWELSQFKKDHSLYPIRLHQKTLTDDLTRSGVLYTVRQVADMYGVKPSTIEKHIVRDQIPVRRNGKWIRISSVVVDQMAEYIPRKIPLTNPTDLV